jgi:hypothetical protein
MGLREEQNAFDVKREGITVEKFRATSMQK